MGANGDETNGNGGGDDGDSNDFRTPADYDALQRLGVAADELGVAYEGLGRSLSAAGPDLPSLEEVQVAAFWERWERERADADELRDRIKAESIRLTRRPILRPPWHL